MPSAQVHTSVNLAALLCGLGVGAGLGLLHAELWQPFALGFAFSTLSLSPDLDLAASVRVDSRKNWGLLGGLWMPFGRLVKHRGVTPFVRGPVVLLAYLSVLVLLVRLMGWLVAGALSLRVPVVVVHPVVVGWGLLGVMSAHAIHVVLDGYRPWDWRRW